MSVVPASPIRLARIIPSLMAVATLAACSDSTVPSGRPMQLSFSTAGSVTAVASTGMSAGGALGDVLVASGSDTLVITSAQVVFTKSELALSGAACDTVSTVDTSSDDCADVHSGPVIVTLPLTAALVTAFDFNAPAGTYTKLEAKVRPFSDSDRSLAVVAAFIAAHPEFTSATVRVTGTYNHTAFTYAAPVEAQLELEFNPPITVSASNINVTVHVDLGTWFRNSTGTLIDPATANPGGANAGIVAENIKTSFHAYEDDDHDGHDDHGTL